MTSLENIKHVYLLGIGGIGMSALARFFQAGGRDVYGYDKTPTELTKELENEGIHIHYEDNLQYLPFFLTGKGINPEALIIYTPAIPKDHKEYLNLLECGYRLWKRSEVLGLITNSYYTIAVAGTHGKTTTSTMIAYILKHSGVDCTAFLGGISKNYHTNLLLGSGEGERPTMVVEADEFDRSFLTLHPDIALVTSLDADHLDIYGDQESMKKSYQEFAGQVKPNGTLIHKEELDLSSPGRQTFSYGIGYRSSFNAINVTVENHNYVFDIEHDGEVHEHFVLTWPGRHNVENTVAAFAACAIYGIEADKIKSAIHSFQGVKRRFDYQLRSENIVFIDDYAHHPEELRAAIASVRELYPGKKILGIFQPHLYSRTRDFADGFGISLSMLDELILMPIYPARELPVPGVDSEMILEKVTSPKKTICNRNEVVNNVLNSDANIVITLGAGDIDQLVEPIRKALTEKYLKQTA